MLKCIYACKYEKRHRWANSTIFFLSWDTQILAWKEREGVSIPPMCVHYFDNSLDICSPGDHPAGQPELALVLPLALSLVIKWTFKINDFSTQLLLKYIIYFLVILDDFQTMRFTECQDIVGSLLYAKFLVFLGREKVVLLLYLSHFLLLSPKRQKLSQQLISGWVLLVKTDSMEGRKPAWNIWKVLGWKMDRSQSKIDFWSNSEKLRPTEQIYHLEHKKTSSTKMLKKVFCQKQWRKLG